jgi:hypothetical protein
MPSQFQQTSGVQCLGAIFENICSDFSFSNHETLAKIARNPIGIEALLAYAKIPHHPHRLACLEAIFRSIYPGFSFTWAPNKIEQAFSVIGKNHIGNQGIITYNNVMRYEGWKYKS